MKRLLPILALLFTCSCVDKSMDLENIDDSIGVQIEEFTFPLGYLKPKSLGEILGTDIDNLVVDPTTGDYSLSYQGEPRSFVIEGSESEFVIQGSKFDVDIDYPLFTLENASSSIDIDYSLKGRYNGMEINQGVTLPIPAGITVSGDDYGSSGYNLDVPVPEYVERIDKVYVMHPENLPGAPIKCVFDLGSLAQINAGATLSIELQLPDEYVVYDQNKRLITDNVFRVTNQHIASGQSGVEFTAYISSIENHHTAEGGVIHLPQELKYHIAYSVTTKQATLKFEQMPSLKINAELVCKDAEVSLSAMSLLDKPIELKNNITFNALNSAVKAVKRVDLDQTLIYFIIEGMEWLSAEAMAAGAADDIIVDITLPRTIEVSPAYNVQYNEATHTVSATLANIADGASVYINAIDLGEGGVVDNRGDVSFGLPLTIGVRLAEGAKIRLSYLEHQGGVKLQVGYLPIYYNIKSVSGFVDYKYSDSLSFDIASIAEGAAIEMNGSGLNPTIDFTLTNPLTIPVAISAKLVPVCEGVAQNNKAIEVAPFEIAPAKVATDGMGVTPVTSTIRIARKAAQESGVVGVECDLASLFNGKFPNGVNVQFEAFTNPDKLATLVLQQQYEILCGYSFAMPISFGSDFSFSFSDTTKGLKDVLNNELLSGTKMYGKVSLIAEISNSTPLSLDLSVDLLDANGRLAPIQINEVGNGVIAGSADGKSLKTSIITFNIASKGEQDVIELLRGVEQLRYTIKASSVANGVPLNENQQIAAHFALCIDGNISIE